MDGIWEVRRLTMTYSGRWETLARGDELHAQSEFQRICTLTKRGYVRLVAPDGFVFNECAIGLKPRAQTQRPDTQPRASGL